MPIPPYTRDAVQRWVAWNSYYRAQSYLYRVKDLDIEVEPARAVVRGRVKGSARSPYEMSAEWDGRAFEGRCSCPVGRRCKHLAALLLAAHDTVAARLDALPMSWREAVGAFAALAPEAPAKAPRAFAFRLRSAPTPGKAHHTLQLAVGAGEGEKFKYGSLSGVHARQGVSAIDKLIAKGLSSLASYGYGRDAWNDISQVDEALRLLAGASRVEDEAGRAIAIHPDRPVTLALAFERGEAGARLTPVVEGVEDGAGATPIGERAPWLWLPDGLHPALGSAEAFKAVRGPIAIPEGELAEFERRYLPDLAIAGRLRGPDAPEAPVVSKGEPAPQLVLEEREGRLVGRLGFLYGGVRVEPDEPVRHVGPPGGPWYARAHAAESRWAAMLPAATSLRRGERPGAGGFSLSGEPALAFLFDRVPELIAAGVEVVGEDTLSSLAVSRSGAHTSVSVKSGIDWLEVEGAVTVGAEAVPWPELWAAIAEKRRYVRLGSGRTARLPADWLEKHMALFQALGFGKKGSRGSVRAARYMAPVIDRLLATADEAHADAPWRAFIEKLRAFGGIEEASLPEGFRGQLRSYQRQGLNFLSFLRDYGLAGILADDMGLGKTVQAAALLQANHAEPGGAPSLVVAPTSVIHNWEAELARFAPGLKTLVLHGPAREVAAIEGCDVVITTYATARLDLEAHARRRYHTLILDEAQAIKNPKSQTAAAVSAIPAAHRLCLTGTPIENNLMELWSQFQFLMPGMLGTESEFKGRFAGPIAWGDKAAAAELKARVGPFILRRLKTEVAKDLPPRTDVPVWCELAPAQRRLYDTVLAAGRERVMSAVADKGVGQSQITILDALLKLRQVCCHPALLGTPETLHLPSAKLEAFLSLVDELVASGHRALVFSQFTRMLAILRERLEAKGHAYEYLDGATRNRQAKVERFNRGSAPLFLISLKAGGTGLNLTGADYVIHFDPWWNPAVEDQATDRAHRIGQTRHVFNYKLFAKDTVEEKLLALQERKRALVRDVLDADALGKQLSLDDLKFLFGEGPAEPERPAPAPAARRAPRASKPQAALAAKVQASGGFRSAEYQAAFGVDGPQAGKELARLVERGVLVKEGATRATVYRPGPGWEAWRRG